MKATFGFIGVGNMGGTLCSAVIKQAGGQNVFAADFDAEKASKFCSENGCRLSSNDEIAQKCDYIFLGVKPQVYPEVLGGIKNILAERKTRFVLVSMAAGVSIEKVLCAAGRSYPIIRIMPNTPARVGKGMILYTCMNTNPQDVDTFIDAMKATGRLDLIPERLIDAASAVSGCGPAFVYMFIEALADGAVECGLSFDKALEYAAQTVLGSAQMVLDSAAHPEALKNAVCSPGGTTIAGVHALEDANFRGAAMSAVTAAYQKTLRLGGK